MLSADGEDSGARGGQSVEAVAVGPEGNGSRSRERPQRDMRGSSKHRVVTSVTQAAKPQRDGSLLRRHSRHEEFERSRAPVLQRAIRGPYGHRRKPEPGGNLRGLAHAPTPRYSARPCATQRAIRSTWGGSSAGRASRSQCEGRGFDPHPLHHHTNMKPWNQTVPGLFVCLLAALQSGYCLLRLAGCRCGRLPQWKLRAGGSRGQCPSIASTSK